MHDRLFLGVTGLATDVQTLSQLLKFRMNLYRLREEREIKPQAFSALLTQVLYEKRYVRPRPDGVRHHVLSRLSRPCFASGVRCHANLSFGPYFTEPVVAGLDEQDQPYISAMDLIGAPVLTKDFVVSGTCTNNLYGMCESMYRPDLEPEDLFETISQCLLASVDRDALSGWGAVVHIIPPEGITSRKLKGRMD